jgi:hypothetical protein
MILSAASVLARLDNDPLREASRLADLPKAEATDSLARMIAGIPRSLWGLPDAIAIAIRLTGLLPARPVRGSEHVFGRPTARTAVVLACIISTLAYAIMATMQSGPPARSNGADVVSFASPAPGDQQREGRHR